ncbi:unnamed protein product [Urochloa decumbens]|uniref:AAA+ ATPase domain-containing protein n=1 Tax=Urochloa decumbens TaxID=240449 RepID=A0ABC9B3Z1_9POAL
MANPLDIAVAGWFFTVMGWLLSPVFSLLWNKLFAYLASDTSRKLRELEILSIPSLKQMLRDVEQQRMGRAAKDKTGSESDLAMLKKIENDLKSARDEAEDILDFVDYYRIERKVLGDRSWVWVQRLLSAAGACITRCKGSWFLTRTETILRAAVLQCAEGLCWLCSTLCRSGEQEQIPISQRPSNSVVQKLRAWSQSLDIKALCRSMQRWLAKKYADACYYRDWSYKEVGIKSNQNDDTAANSLLPVIEEWRLKKRIEQIENIVSDSKKSHLLNEDSSSSKILVKDTNNKDSGSTQEEIDDLHRGIKWEVFGREKEREHICNMLRKGSDAYGSKPFCVIGIHGITGSGKSTLAQYVCDHEKKAEDKHFDLIMFSHVSMTFRVDKIFRDMLEQITQDQPSDISDLKSLQMKLKEKLEGKRFLLVLDDLWVNNENQKGLDILLDALNAGQSGSKILVTAQREDAAAALHGVLEQISVPDLDDKDYLSLFMHHARPGAVNDDGEYRRIGSMIANKLHRSPIAAVTVGKQVRRNPNIDFWKETANNDVLNETMGALWWSYQQLGPDIRQCFAYCSTFPRGYNLKRDELIRIWIAHGFIKTRTDATEELEDAGKRYFDELLTFSFLQGQRTFFFGIETGKFRVAHDLLHELAVRVAGCDFHRIDLDWSPKDIPQGVRHVFIETNNVAEIAENYLDLGNLRTLIIKEEHLTDTDRNHDLEKDFESLFMRMTKLRVLIVELKNKTQGLFSVPASIDQMKHLRYFCFKCKGYTWHSLILPSTISKLYHMQTIEVGPSYCDVTCPEDMSNLIHLRHISGSLVFPNVGRLTSLQTLPWFKVCEERGYELKQLKHLNNLRGTLEIRGLGVVESKEEALEAHLTQKKRLTKLKLSFFGCWSRDQDIVAEVFEGLCPPEDLQELCIWYYKCPSLRYPSWMLSRQHPDAPKRLQTLELHQCCRLASIPEDSLLELRITNCEWDSLPENMERLVSLQTLTILGCHKMHFLPMLPQSLREIKIYDCRVLSTTCEEEGHENWQKIQHIPEKDIYSSWMLRRHRRQVVEGILRPVQIINKILRPVQIINKSVGSGP